jgi:hypothetical protein
MEIRAANIGNPKSIPMHRISIIVAVFLAISGIHCLISFWNPRCIECGMGPVASGAGHQIGLAPGSVCKR